MRAARKLSAGVSCAIVAGALLGAGSAPAVPGDSDETFGRNGYATVLVRAPDERGVPGRPSQVATFYDMAVQADGKVLLAGLLDFHAPVVVRLESDGTRDRSFGRRGFAYPEPGTQFFGATTVIAALPGGGFVLADLTRDGIAVIRLTQAGQPDTTFAGDGSTLIDLDGVTLADLAVNSDGGIVLAAWNLDSLFVAKLTAAGERDGTFSGDGVAVDPGKESREAAEVAVAADGSVTVAGSVIESGGGPFVTRFTPGGEVDMGFGASGSFTPKIGGRATGLSLDESGRTFFSVIRDEFASRSVFEVFGLGPDGQRDLTFGVRGRAAIAFGRNAKSYDVEIGLGGSVNVVGSTVAAGEDFAVARLTPDGLPDPAFSDDGRRVSDLRCEFRGEVATRAAVDPEGRLLAAGDCGLGNFRVARYEAVEGPADEDADGTVDSLDRCIGSAGPPSAAGKRRAGCPAVPRVIEDFYVSKRSLVRGVIVSKDAACAFDQSVAVFRAAAGEDELIGTDLGPSIKLQAPEGGGRYYAVIEENLEPDAGLCAAAATRPKSPDRD